VGNESRKDGVLGNVSVTGGSKFKSDTTFNVIANVFLDENEPNCITIDGRVMTRAYFE
jgi:hypothetical protein